MFRYIISLMLVLVGTSVYAQTANDPLYTDSTTRSTVDSKTDSKTTVISPPPSAISPTINTSNSDLCTVGVAGAIQTQILGISAGNTVRDMNCEKLKNAKTLYDMGMKVAAVSVMCQDERVFDAMMQAGTPCPYDGLIGSQAKEAWNANEHKKPGYKEKKGLNLDEEDKSTLIGVGAVLGLLGLLLF